MAIAIKTAGIKVSYAVESTAGTRPTTGYIHIPGIKEIPDMNPTPDTLETTTLDNLDFKTYINGLKDLGGALSFTAGFTQSLLDLWNGTGVDDTTSLIARYNAGKAESKKTWLCVDIPGIDKSSFFTFEPSKIGMPGGGISSVMEITLFITPTGEPEWCADPTYSTDSVSAVTFTVVDGSASPVAGATIVLNNEYSITTNASGTATLDVKYGDYFYKASADALSDYFGGFTADGATKAVSVTMTA